MLSSGRWGTPRPNANIQSQGRGWGPKSGRGGGTSWGGANRGQQGGGGYYNPPSNPYMTNPPTPGWQGQQGPPMPYGGPQRGKTPRYGQGGGIQGLGGVGGRADIAQRREDARREYDKYGGYGSKQANMMANVGQMQQMFGQMPGFGNAIQEAMKFMYAPGWGTNEFPFQQFIGQLTGGWGSDPAGNRMITPGMQGY